MATPSDPVTNIVLTGFMGVGKTTIGRRVADVVQRRFVDTDDVIVQRAGMSIPQLFVLFGEPHFRALEREIAHELAGETRLVIATGGGMLVNDENRAALSKTGFVVCLDAPPELIEERLKKTQDRPLAANWRDLFQKRQAAYGAIPLHISVAGKTTDQTAQEIIALWRTTAST
ncbi:MAG: shikimate kinase [bacterium]|nr:shikimate kinase [bacterium]